MAHELSVSFKVFLQNGATSEVRRFGVDRDVVSNFGYLKEKLQTVFPSLRGANFIVAWKDSDGDNIVISSDDELIIALTEMQTDVRKLYATVQEGTPMQQDGDSHHVHVGVTCDGCQKGVEGFRYKCIQCPDYDLCSNCESKGIHGEHYMIRMPVPTFWRPHFGKRLAHHLAKATHKGGVHGGWDSEGGCHWKYHGKHHGDKRHDDKHQYHGDRHHFEWLETLGAYLNDWSNLPGEDGTQGKDDSKGCSSGSQQKSQEQKEDARVQYLRNIGQTVASVLDPLGIDVDIEVRTKNKDEKVSKPGEEQKKKDNKEDEVSQMDVDDKQDNNNASNNTTPARSQRESPESEGWTVVSEEIPQQAAATQTSSDAAAVSSSAETGAVPKQPATSSAPPTTTAQNSTPVSSANVYPTLFNLPSQVPTVFPMNIPHMPPHMPPHIAPPLMPHVAPPHMVPHPPNPFMNHQPNMFIPHQQGLKPHITDALEKMMSMGFSNDGGWLTQLLESKNGDIEKALDVLQPVAVKKSK